MYLSAVEVQSLTELTLLNFIGLGLKEGPYIDYKRKISVGELREKKEILKDVTGFANAAGGLILIGVDEPSRAPLPRQRLHGVEDGLKLAKTVETLLRTHIDPRIPGVLVWPVDVLSDRHCLIIWVPASVAKPHMITIDEECRFYVRHTESSVPMRSDEVRSAVLSTSTHEKVARAYCERKHNEIRKRAATNSSYFHLQAVPLLPFVRDWDVYSAGFEKIIRGSDRVRDFDTIRLDARTPRRILEGVGGFGDGKPPLWRTEIHRNGYVSVEYSLNNWEQVGNSMAVVATDAIDELFSAFAKILRKCINTSRMATPYLILCSYRGARSTVVRLQHSDTYGPLELEEIVWPEQRLDVGENVAGVATQMANDFFNAFGVDDEVRPGGGMSRD